MAVLLAIAAMPPNRDRVSIDLTGTDIREKIEALIDSDRTFQGRSLSQALRMLLEDGLSGQGESGHNGTDGKDEQLLAGFLRCLIETGDHDGYSLAELAEVIGLESDQPLVELIDQIQRGRSKQGGKPKTQRR